MSISEGTVVDEDTREKINDLLADKGSIYGVRDSQMPDKSEDGAVPKQVESASNQVDGASEIDDAKENKQKPNDVPNPTEQVRYRPRKFSDTQNLNHSY